jgi:dihydropteroate synthase
MLRSDAPAPLILPRGRTLPLDPPVLMGVLNVTPDSFSDGGQWYDGSAQAIQFAVRHGLELARQGAAILDIGGESTRPGANRIPPEEQIRRIDPVIWQLRLALRDEGRDHIALSIDTTRAEVADAALLAGADVINDVSAGSDDPAMFALAADRGVPLVLMHMLGQPATMQQQPKYADVVAEVEDYLLQRAKSAQQAGVRRSQIALDPGIGFGKTLEHNLALLAALPRLASHGYPLLLGASRKSFIQKLDPAASDPADRLPGTLATTALGVAAGVHIFRVHDVAPNAQTLKVALAVRAASR